MASPRQLRRIDCVGNANNYILLIALALRDMGIDAHLHLTMGGERDQPEALYPEYATNYPAWIHDWRTDKTHLDLRSSPDVVRELCAVLAQADGLLLNFDSVALGSLLAKPCVCVLTGTDLYDFSTPGQLLNSFYGTAGNLSRSDARHYQTQLLHTLRQRAAIRNACGFTFFPKGLLPKADAILHNIGVHQERRISLMLADTVTQTYIPQPFRREMRILYGARLSWDIGAGDCTELDDKGTDVFLRAFARYIRSGGKARLRLFRVGARLAEAETMVRELHMESHVDWCDHLPQHAFNEALEEADLVVDQTGTSHIGMAVVDAMTKGRPVLAKAPDMALWGIGEDLPICHAATEDDICSWLQRLDGDPALRERIGLASRAFVEKHWSASIAAQKITHALRFGEQNTDEVLLWQRYEFAKMREEWQTNLRIAASAFPETPSGTRE